MIKIQSDPSVNESNIKKLMNQDNFTINGDITIEDGASIYLDPEAKGLIIHDNVSISRGAHIEVNKGAMITIGKNVTIGRSSTISSMSIINIMDGVGIANNVSIRDHNHKTNSHVNIFTDNLSPWMSGFDAAPITIEYKALISDDVRISLGVRVGQNSRVGAGVYLRRNIPPNCNVVGDSKKVLIQEEFSGPLISVDKNDYTYCFFGDSLIDRPSIVVRDPHYDLPPIGHKVPVKSHETAGFYKELQKHLKCGYPEYRHNFENKAQGGSNIRDVNDQVASATSKNACWDISFVCVGVNDIWRKFQGRADEAVDHDQYIHEYKKIINKLLEYSRVVICIGEPPVNLTERSEEINEELVLYNHSLHSLINNNFKNEDVFYVSLYNSFSRLHEISSAYSPEESLWIDGVHLSDMGNFYAGKIIYEFINSKGLSKKIFRLKAIDREKASKFYR